MSGSDDPDIFPPPPPNGRFGNGPSPEQAVQVQAAFRALFSGLESALGEIHEAAETACAVGDVIEDVGEAYLDAEEHGEDPHKAALDALEPRDDDDDNLRAGLRFFVEACAGIGPVARSGGGGQRTKKGRRRKR